MPILIYHAEPELEFQAELVQWMFGSPQVSSYENANIVMIKVSPDAFNLAHCFFNLNLALCFNCLCIKLIGVVWHRSCNRIDLPIYPS
jgi:hypothetical protein